jgi:transposase-like protein
MEKSSKRGKIPQQDWPAIIKRYESGETLASIARTYDCSPPAISYIVSRSRARNAAGEGVKELSESELRGQMKELPPSNGSQAEEPHGGVSEEQIDTHELRAVEPAPESALPIMTPTTRLEPQSASEDMPLANGGMAPEQPGGGVHDAKPEGRDGSFVFGAAHANQSGAQRRTLHLSSPSQSAPSASRPNQDAPSSHLTESSGRVIVSASAKQPELAEHAGQTTAPSSFAPVTINGPARKMADTHGARDGAFIDQALRERVEGDISAFLAAFDAALARDTLESRTGLREATDRLLRAGARTRIELERLEARVPLPPRDNGANAPSAWRPR